MPTLAEGFNQELNPLGPVGDPTPKKQKAAGFGQEASLPSPTQQATSSPRLSTNYIAQSDLEDYMAKNQSGLELFGKASIQSVSNAILGTVETASYLGDLEQLWDKLHGDEQEYTNWVADAMKSAKENINQDLLKIHQTSIAQEGFAPWDATWWSSQAPEVIGSVLSLAIPAGGVAGVVGKGASILGAGERGVKLASTLGATLASRYAESTMEANGVYQRIYNDLTSKGVDKEVAKQRAGEQASNVWNTNWLFAAQDFLEYSTLLKGFSSLAKGKPGSTIGQILKQTGIEASEEAGQFVVSEEAYRAATEVNTDYFGEGFGLRLSDYIRDPDFKASTLLGAFGGGVFTGAAPLTKAAVQKGEAAIKYAKEQAKTLVNRGIQKEKANYTGDKGTSQTISDIEFAERAIRDISLGKLPQFKKELETLEKTPDLDPENRQLLKNYQEDIDFLETEHARLKSSEVATDLHTKVLTTKLEQRQKARLQDSIEGEIQKIEQELIKNKELTPELSQLKKIQATTEAYKKLAKTNNKFALTAANLQKQFNQEKEAASKILPEGQSIDELLTTGQDQVLFEKMFQYVATKEKIAQLKKDIVDLTTTEGQKKAIKAQEAKKRNQEIEVLINNPDVTIEAIKNELKKDNPAASQDMLLGKLQELVSNKQNKNKEETGEIAGSRLPEDEGFPDELGGPEDINPEDIEPDPNVLDPGKFVSNELVEIK